MAVSLVLAAGLVAIVVLLAIGIVELRRTPERTAKALARVLPAAPTRAASAGTAASGPRAARLLKDALAPLRSDVARRAFNDADDTVGDRSARLPPLRDE